MPVALFKYLIIPFFVEIHIYTWLSVYSSRLHHSIGTTVHESDKY